MSFGKSGPGGLGGKRAGAGRKPGARNKRTKSIEERAKSIVEDADVQHTMLEQAKAGTLPPQLMVLLHHYSYGKPIERIEHSGNADKPVILKIRRG